MLSLQLLHVAQCLLLCLYLWNSATLRPLASRVLAANYGLFAIQSLLALAVLSGGVWPLEPIHFTKLRATMAFTLGPCLLLYYHAVVVQKIDIRDALHFTPALTIGFILFTMPSLLAWIAPFIDGLIITSFTVYLASAAFTLGKYGQLTHLGIYARNARHFLTLLMLVMVVNVGIELGIVVEMLRIPAKLNTYSDSS